MNQHTEDQNHWRNMVAYHERKLSELDNLPGSNAVWERDYHSDRAADCAAMFVKSGGSILMGRVEG